MTQVGILPDLVERRSIYGQNFPEMGTIKGVIWGTKSSGKYSDRGERSISVCKVFS